MAIAEAPDMLDLPHCSPSGGDCHYVSVTQPASFSKSFAREFWRRCWTSADQSCKADKGKQNGSEWQHVLIGRQDREGRNPWLGHDCRGKRQARAPLRPTVDRTAAGSLRQDCRAKIKHVGLVGLELEQVPGTVEPDSWMALRVWTLDVPGCKPRKTGARSLVVPMQLSRGVVLERTQVIRVVR